MSDLTSLERTAGDYWIVYECLMAYNHQVRVAEGYSGDTRHSHYERRQRTWHVAAASQGLAESAWLKEFGWPNSENELVLCKAVLVLDKEVYIR